MKLVINPYDRKSILKAKKKIDAYQNKFKAMETELLERLAFMGATKVSLGFARAIYDEGNDVQVSTLIYGNTAVIKAQGEDVCFIEFGAGVRYGYGYPGERPEGVVGIGEYGKGKGKNPKGWWYSKNGSSHHTYGNPPAMVMYNTSTELAEQITEIAREVFKL